MTESRSFVCVPCQFAWEMPLGKDCPIWCPSCGSKFVQWRTELEQLARIEALENTLIDLTSQVTMVLDLINVEVKGRAAYEQWKKQLDLPEDEPGLANVLKNLRTAKGASEP